MNWNDLHVITNIEKNQFLNFQNHASKVHYYDGATGPPVSSQSCCSPERTMKRTASPPTSAVTTSASAGAGVATPKFSTRPLPVDTSETTAVAKLIMASRPAHTSTALPPLLLCSHRTDSARAAALLDLEEPLTTRARQREPTESRWRGEAAWAAAAASGEERSAEENAMG